MTERHVYTRSIWGLSGLILSCFTLAKEPQWQLVWQDEFDSQQIDASKWQHEQNCWGGGNNEQQCYTNSAKNSYIEDGVLHIVALPEKTRGSIVHEDSSDYDPAKTREQPYSSARLRTKGKVAWQYGRFEIRARAPAGQGVWPAIWMLPEENRYGPWAASGEIDIFEAVNLNAHSDAKDMAPGTPEKRVYGTLHYGGVKPHNAYTGTYYYLPDAQSPSDDFHVYALEWQADEMRWYVDGEHYATQTADTWYTKAVSDTLTEHPYAPFDQPFHLLINLAIGGEWPERTNQTGVDTTAIPARFLIDYVRVYQCSDPERGGSECAIRGENATQVTTNINDH